MRSVSILTIALLTGLALAGCANRQRIAPLNAPPVGASSLGPAGTTGMTNSPVTGSTSNAASGSSILREEGPLSGAPIAQ